MSGLMVRDSEITAESELTQPARRLEWESKVGTDSLDVLHAKRRALLEHLAPLRALHAHNGVWDDRRKQLLEACKVRARMTLTKDFAKITEGLVESTAYDDPQYKALLDDAVSEKITFIMLENEISEITERIRSREFEFSAWSAEARLAR